MACSNQTTSSTSSSPQISPVHGSRTDYYSSTGEEESDHKGDGCTQTRSDVDHCIEDVLNESEAVVDEHKGYEGDEHDEEGYLYAQLAAKERDLILAAELGKALLEKNEELTRRNEEITEEYSAKIEELAQEKHALKLRLESMERQYDNTVKDLREEYTSLRREIEEREETAKLREHGKSDVLQELTNQNDKLAEQLRKTSLAEGTLQQEVDALRSQIHDRRSSLHDQAHEVQVLKEEIEYLTEKQTLTEHSLYNISEERESYINELEEANRTIRVLGQEAEQHKEKIEFQHQEICDLTERCSHLQGVVEELDLQVSSSMLDQSTASLYNELEMSGMNRSHSMESIQSGEETGPNLPLHHWSAQSFQHNSQMPQGVTSFHNHLEEDDDGLECDDEFDLTSHNDMQLMLKLHCSSDNGDDKQMKQDILALYQELRQLTGTAQDVEEQMWTSTSSLDSNSTEHIDPSSALHKIRSLFQDVIQARQELEKKKVDSKSESDLNNLQVRIEVLEHELQQSHEQIAHLKAKLEFKHLALQRKEEEFQEISGKMKLTVHQLSLQQDELMVLQEERDRLLDHAASVSRDEVISSARSERNCAIERSNRMEMELTRAKLDLMKLDSQLLEAIQQKVQLSQQLERWQMDMAELIDIQKMMSKGVPLNQNQRKTEDQQTAEEHSTTTTTTEKHQSSWK